MSKSLKWIGRFLVLVCLILGCAYLYAHRERQVVVVDNQMVFIKGKDSSISLYRNNAPFKIRGASGNASFELLSKVGANTVRVYDTINLLGVLNIALKNNLSVIVDLNLPKYNEAYNYYDDKDETDKLKLKLKKLVSKHKNHPALLFWNLGNELNYPLVLIKNNFINTYNELIDMIHETDPNHLVSTTLIPSQSQTLAIHCHSPNIDVIGFNVFGNIKRIQMVLDRVKIFTNTLPYYISEYGYNGPWEQQMTLWKAPLEPTSSKKAEQYIQRYNRYLKNDKESLGDLVFYWGQKQERTQTWFSILDQEGRKSELLYELNTLWGGQMNDEKRPAKINYMIIDGKGAQDNLVYDSNMEKTAHLFLTDSLDETYEFVWEIYAEGWDYNQSEIEKAPVRIASDSIVGRCTYTFRTPSKSGAYRIFVFVYDHFGNYATTNTPFYVLN
ncbi:glycoside hydrolase family 2 TIM barrel-domain containing protein [uncultured Algibacter sp.]|uniref:glycoside hydrolase family 2 TIM barrel-domain containing protein n=1 Tax=uncultured Algibacter sp. TaxID=298659 RepID=UPI002627B273|nr:glycoside hydrolase family 2 TIM barrel-domain containing protein [uncultured Algibacter sp.]